MRRTSVHDFHLVLESEGDGFQCQILRSLEGRAKSEFMPPGFQALPAGLSLRQEAEARGRVLFEALFQGPVGDKYRQCLKKMEGAGTGPRRSLRVRLAMDPNVPALAPLFQLDWEQMFDGERDHFLTRSQRTTLVRDLELPVPLLDLPGTRPWRLLVVGAQPSGGWAFVDFDAELELIRSALKDSADIEIEAMRRTQLRQLEARLRREQPIHILHFIGHGAVDEGEVEGTLIFEGPDGSAHPVSGKQLAERLEGNPDLRLVVLNACESAKGPANLPSRSVAASLMKAGVPAVIAMRFKVPDGSAMAFSDAFYQALASEIPVDAAATAARLAIDDTDEMFEQWAAPALFMSSDDGMVFQFSGDRIKPKSLGVRTRAHPFDNLDEECEHVLDLVPFFDGRTIREPDDWRDKVVPFLDHFLCKHVRTRRPLALRIDAHLTVSFAAGYLIDTRGVDVTIRQALPVGGFRDWRVDFDQPYEGPLWAKREVSRTEAGNEVAVAIGITNDNLGHVESYVKRRLNDRVGRILAVVPDDESGNTSIRDANHAFALAQELKRMIDQRSQEEQEGPLHLFLAAPGSFTFFLGQLLRGQGEIQLYEWEFENRGSRNYTPSLLLATELGGRR